MANQVTFIFKAVDKYTAVGRNINSMNKRMQNGFRNLGRSIRRGSEALTDMGKRLQKVGKGVSKLGKQISMKLSLPMAAFSALSIRNWDLQ